MKIKFKIVTPERTVYESEVDQATLPVADGEVTILPNHRSYIAALKAGEIILKNNCEEVSMVTSGGFIEFNNNALVVLADTAEHAVICHHVSRIVGRKSLYQSIIFRGPR